ncbi:MAG: gliding motility lipoprotein GldD [Bacteroidetes bacterium HGW-Bacteroidetes-4]|jgi:gliding motility-associated lipoprotein GldD|nr:MAG: gliding motility lipoprotein GldD [Bacteroidetes bacterium HGW-Bacteroidetes-4]
MHNYFILLISLFLLSVSCNSDYTPKPRGYFRIDLPEREYKQTPEKLPYAFEYPVYSVLVNYRQTQPELYWINLVFPKFNATLHLSYKTIDNNLEEYLNDSRNFVYKHTVKADAISETPYLNAEKKVYGILYDIKGDAASNTQFFLTDSTHNFIRGALYFEVYPNKDSLAPVLDFINKDLVHLIETFEWN